MRRVRSSAREGGPEEVEEVLEEERREVWRRKSRCQLKTCVGRGSQPLITSRTSTALRRENFEESGIGKGERESGKGRKERRKRGKESRTVSTSTSCTPALLTHCATANNNTLLIVLAPLTNIAGPCRVISL